MERINEFLAEIRITFLVGILLLVLVCWLHKDNRRNERVYEDTNATVAMQQWVELKNESAALSNELTAYKTELTRLKKPSAELLSQLETAEKMLSKLQTELAEQKKDLIALSKDKDELKTSLQTLKQQINHERKIHKRQVWQNRFWCIIIGTGIGIAASR